MKRKTILSIVLTSVTFFLNAQILFTENFTSTWAAATQGWVVINNSLPVGTTTVFQGNGAGVFPAFNGAANDYVGMNFNSCSGAGGISTWLITPTLNISNGLVFEFATRTTSPIQFADRLQLRMSPVDNVAIPSGTTSVGTYTTLMLDINPNLGVNNSSVVVGNSVNGYPDAWAVYTVAVSGLAGPTIGRFALRYFVADGGPSGNESNYIGIDAVKISNPCNQPIINISQTSSGVCSGGTVNLSATSSGTNAATTFTWSSGQTGASTIVSPTITTTYVVSGTGAANCIGTQTAVVTVTASPNVNVSSFTVCSSPVTSATLIANGASSYSWNTGSTNSSIVVTPNSTTVYTVTGYGAGGNCPNVKTATITLGAQLSMAIISSSSVLCSGGTVTLSALSAATTYSWSNGATTPVITVTPGASSIYTVVGISGSFPVVCFGTNSISITVNPSPVLAVLLTPSVLCAGVGSVTINASGANTYFYLGSSANPKSTSTPTAPGAYSFTISGTSNGCVSLGQVTLSVEANPTVTIFANKVSACIDQVVTLTASGADTYVWSGQINSTSNPITYSATSVGTKVFNAIGTSSLGCTSALVAKSVTVSLCTGIENEPGNNTESSIFPNPFTNELTISGLNGRIEIYNLLGQIILKTKVNEVERINTSELIKGAYILKTFNSDGQELKTIKLLKN